MLNSILFFFLKMNSNSCKLWVTPILHLFVVPAFGSCQNSHTGSITHKLLFQMECFHIKLHTLHFFFLLLNKLWARLPIQIHCTTQSLQKGERSQGVFGPRPFTLTLKSLRLLQMDLIYSLFICHASITALL